MKLLKLTFLFIMSAMFAHAASADVPNSQSAPISKNHVLSTPVTVLELFTSQGCSSCPPANKFVRELSQDTDVLALSYSVDYWDYRGWKDTFGKPEFSARQRTYGKQFSGKVYTPQMVVNGALHSSRLSTKKVRAQKLENVPEILINAEGADLNIHVLAARVSKNPLSIMAVRYRPGVQKVPVKRGENKGRTLTLANVVQACTEIGKIKTATNFSKILPRLNDGEALVIMVQDGKGGPILGAANYAP